LAEHVDNFLDSITIADLLNKARPEVVYGLRLKSKRILDRADKIEDLVESKTADVA